MPDDRLTWRLMLLAMGAALASAAGLGLAVYAGVLYAAGG